MSTETPNSSEIQAQNNEKPKEAGMEDVGKKMNEGDKLIEKESIKDMTMEQKRNEFTIPRGNLNEINFKGNKAAESMIGLKDLFDAPMVRVMKSGMGKEGLVLAERGADGNYYIQGTGKKATIYSGDIVAPLSQDSVDKLKAKQIPLAELTKEIPLASLNRGDDIPLASLGK